VKVDCVHKGIFCKGCAKVLLELFQDKKPFRNLLSNGILSKQCVCKLLGMHVHSSTFKLALFSLFAFILKNNTIQPIVHAFF